MTQSVSSDRAQLGQLGPVLALRPSPRFQVESWTSAASPKKGFVAPLHTPPAAEPSAPRHLLSPPRSPQPQLVTLGTCESESWAGALARLCPALRGARSHLQQPPRCPLTPPGRSHTAFGVSRHRCTPPSSLAAAGGARCLLLCAVLVSQPAPCTVPPRSPPIWDATGCWRSLRISASSRGCPGNREVFLQPSRKCHCHDFQRRFLPGHTAAFLPLGPAAHGRTRSQSSASLPVCFFLLLQGPGSSPRCSWPRAGVWLLSWDAAGSCGAVSASAAAQGGGWWRRFLPSQGRLWELGLAKPF